MSENTNTTQTNNNKPESKKLENKIKNLLASSEEMDGETDYWKDLDITRFFFFGTSVYLVECAILYPLDVIKTRLQVDMKPDIGLFRSTVETTKKIWHTNGFKGFFHGYWTSTVGSLPSNALYVLTYQYCKHALQVFHRKMFIESATEGSEKHGVPAASSWVPFVAGGMADVTSTYLMVPSDVISQRMQLGDHRYKSGMEAFRIILREEGLKGLFRGSGATLITYVPGSAVWWAVYENGKRFLTANDPRAKFPSIFGNYSPKSKDEINKDLKESKNYFAQIVAGASAGTAASIVINPLDVVKTRMQVQSPGSSVYYNSIFSGLKHVVHTEGYASLMKGITPKVLSSALMSSISSLVYEYIMKQSRKQEVETMNVPAAKS